LQQQAAIPRSKWPWRTIDGRVKHCRLRFNNQLSTSFHTTTPSHNNLTTYSIIAMVVVILVGEVPARLRQSNATPLWWWMMMWPSTWDLSRCGSAYCIARVNLDLTVLGTSAHINLDDTNQNYR